MDDGYIIETTLRKAVILIFNKKEDMKKVNSILEYVNTNVRMPLKKHVVGDRQLSLFFNNQGDALYAVSKELSKIFHLKSEVKTVKYREKKSNVSNEAKKEDVQFGNPFLKTPEVSFLDTSKHKRNDNLYSGSKLRIDLNIGDIKEMEEYLKTAPVNRQTRKRYDSAQEREVGDVEKENKRSTYIASNVCINKRSVEVYVNGQLSSNIKCDIKETVDAYILYLYFKGQRRYARPVNIIKDVAKEPILRIRYNEKEKVINVNGKSLGITFVGYEKYRRSKIESSEKEKGNELPTVKYEGDPIREKRTAIIKNTSVETTGDIISVQIKDNLHTPSVFDIESNHNCCDQNDSVKTNKPQTINIFVKLKNIIINIVKEVRGRLNRIVRKK